METISEHIEDFNYEDIESDHEFCKRLYKRLVSHVVNGNCVVITGEVHSWWYNMCKQLDMETIQLCAAFDALEHDNKIKVWYKNNNVKYITLHNIYGIDYDIDEEPILSRYNVLDQLKLF